MNKAKASVSKGRVQGVRVSKLIRRNS